jgi:hypothetical protein
MNVPAYAIIDKPKPRPPPVKSELEILYQQACNEFLFACFNGYPPSIIKARAERMREIRGKI